MARGGVSVEWNVAKVDEVPRGEGSEGVERCGLAGGGFAVACEAELSGRGRQEAERVRVQDKLHPVQQRHVGVCALRVVEHGGADAVGLADVPHEVVRL